MNARKVMSLAVTLVVAVAGATALLPAQAPSAADPRVAKSAATDCATLKDLRWPGITITEAPDPQPGRP
jgi:hypothetical protein